MSCVYQSRQKAYNSKQKDLNTKPKYMCNPIVLCLIFITERTPETWFKTSPYKVKSFTPNLDLAFLKLKRSWVTLRMYPPLQSLHKYFLKFSPYLPLIWCHPLIRVNVFWAKGNNQRFQVSPSTDCESTLAPEIRNSRSGKVELCVVSW